jgi:cytochrome b involved in lipid metabolism
MSIKKGVTLFLAVFILSGCGAKKLPVPPPKELAGISMATVAAHGFPDDCWLVINNNIYSLSEFIAQHEEEGARIAEKCGQDATVVFEAWPMGSGKPHSDEARAVLENYYIGDLAR